MAFTWEDYEALAATMYEILGKDVGIEIECYGRNCKIGDDQIDVLFRQSNGLQYTRTAIECKYLKDRVGLRTVNEFFGKIKKLGINKGIIVSQMGFTPPAYAAAERCQIIELVELRVPLESDWVEMFQGTIQEIVINYTLLVNEVYDLSVGASESTIEVGPYEVPPQSAIVAYPDQSTKTFQQIFDQTRHDYPDVDSHSVQFPVGTTLTIDGVPGEAQLRSLNFKTRTVESGSFDQRIELRQQVAYIVKSLLDDSEYLWFKNQRIKEHHRLPQEATK